MNSSSQQTSLVSNYFYLLVVQAQIQMVSKAVIKLAYIWEKPSLNPDWWPAILVKEMQG